jgi:hypothetical protein
VVDAGEDLIEPRSGSVIDVEGISVDGHPTIVQSVRDTAHGVDCSVQLANDGTMRCLPTGKILKILYTDPDCKNAVAVDDAGNDVSCPPQTAQYAAHKFEAVCPSKGETLYSVGAPIPAPAQVYAASVFGCDLVPSSSSYTRYSATTPSPPAEWIAFKHEVKPITNRLGVGYWAGSDGSQLIDSAWLLEQDAPCRHELDQSGNERCIPSRRAYTDSAYFTDNTCKTNVAVTFICDPPDLLFSNSEYDPSAVGCSQPPISRQFSTAKHIDSLLVYSTSDGSCATTKYGGFLYYGPGTPVSFDVFPEISSTHGGTGRLQRMFWTSEGKRLYADGLYDTDLDGPCHPVMARAGNLCQLDNGYYGGAYFADKACSIPLYPGNAKCTQPRAILDSYSGGFECSVELAASARRVLKEHVGAAYTSDDGFGGGCAPVPSTPGLVLYDLGEPVAPEKIFAPLPATKL